MAREPIPTWCFALVLVRNAGRYLMVQERRHQQAWYLPAGRVEPGESLAEGAVRETLEEAGVRVALDGVLRIEHSPLATGGARLRVIFTAHPIDNRPPKRSPDEHSLQARWVSLPELARLPMRDRKVLQMCRYLANGGLVSPLSVLTREGAPMPGFGSPGR